METADNLPEFFKVYIRHLSLHRMLIPSEFVDYMGRGKSGSAELAGPSGQTWRVELVEDGKDLYFVDGWEDFVDGNLVRDGDFLFFKFHGSLIFSVVIYDASMCEKEMVYVDEGTQGRDGSLEIGEEPNGAEAVMKRIVGPSQPEVDKTAEQTATSVKPSFEKSVTISSFSLPKSFLLEHSLSYNSYEKMVLRTSGNSSWEVNIINNHGKVSLCGGWLAFARENCIMVGEICKFELLDRLEMVVHVANQKEGVGQKMVKSKISSLKPAAEVSQPRLRLGSRCITEGQKAAARTMPSSVKPSFVLVMSKHNVERHRRLTIPAKFIRENSLRYESNEKMVLRTKKDSFWPPVNIIKNRVTNLCRFCGGWGTFVRCNNIKIGDKCKFELLNRLEMMVHITRTKKVANLQKKNAR